MLDLLSSLLLGTSAQETAKPKLEITGNYNFYVEPSIVGFEAYHSSTLVITVYENLTKKKQLDFVVKWSKILNNEPYDMENYQETHYHLTPSDIDLKIRAAISCKDPQYSGVAYLYLGPIELDKTVSPELEGLVINLKGSFKVQIMSQNNIALRPNESVIRIDKPYLTVNFDPSILGSVTYNKSDTEPFLPIEINFEADQELKIRIDNYSTTVVVFAYKEESKDGRLVIQFETREQRDVFYIFVRLMRSIKKGFMDRLISEYDILVHAPWSFLNLKLGEEQDDPEGQLSFFEILYFDSTREHLRDLLRMRRELSQESLVLTDSLVVMETDLLECTKQFRELLNESKSGKPVRNLAKYEKSRSVLGELSFSILGGIKKGEGSPRKREEEVVTKEDLEKELKQYKEANSKLKKGIEALKKGDSLINSPNPVFQLSVHLLYLEI